jgi:hypothetical protein
MRAGLHIRDFFVGEFWIGGRLQETSKSKPGAAGRGRTGAATIARNAAAQGSEPLGGMPGRRRCRDRTHRALLNYDISGALNIWARWYKFIVPEGESHA